MKIITSCVDSNDLYLQDEECARANIALLDQLSVVEGLAYNIKVEGGADMIVGIMNAHRQNKPLLEYCAKVLERLINKVRCITCSL